MKKLILPIACIVLLASCKKDFTCECDVLETTTSPSVDNSYSYSTTTVFKGVKKKYVQDKAECYSTEQTQVEYNASLDEDITYTTTSDCTISK
jgi:hypothetical protein